MTSRVGGSNYINEPPHKAICINNQFISFVKVVNQCFLKVREYVDDILETFLTGGLAGAGGWVGIKYIFMKGERDRG